MCLEPPLVQRPKGSSPGRGIKDWICFHCECALPVVVAAGEDDPDAMEALSWSEDFSPPSENKLKAFWGREHGRAKVEHEERAEMDRKRKENERRRRAEREESGLEVEEDRAQGGGKHGGRKYTGNVSALPLWTTRRHCVFLQRGQFITLDGLVLSLLEPTCNKRYLQVQVCCSQVTRF